MQAGAPVGGADRPQPRRPRLVAAGLAIVLANATPACSTDPEPGSVPRLAAVATELAEAYCGLLRTCCSDQHQPYGQHGDLESCVEATADDYRLSRFRTYEDGHPFDPRCAAMELALYERADCSGEAFAEMRCEISWCSAHLFDPGDRQLGESCSDSAECDLFLACDEGVCVRHCAIPEGGRCGQDLDDVPSSCRDDLICGADSVCVPPAAKSAEGDPCQTLATCEPTLQCQGGTCRPRLALGDACEESSCISDPFCGCPVDASCRGGRCEAAPTQGQPCPDGFCAAGHFCGRAQGADHDACFEIAPPQCPG
jgi:hypothetical protein